MKIKSIILIVMVLSACKPENQTASNENVVTAEPEVETRSMVSILKDLNDNGDPNVLYHWNKRLADLHKAEMLKAPTEMKHWFQYCSQLLKAGENETCINEIESLIRKNGATKEQLVNEQTLPIIELLALAYLRLGEVNNCQKYHNEYSCILPLKNEAFHIEMEGSKKAIEVYSMIYKKIPER